jgi:hypothetical protein
LITTAASVSSRKTWGIAVDRFSRKTKHATYHCF